MTMGSGATRGLTLLLGPPNSGKRGVVLQWWSERLPNRPVVVMPTALDAQDMSAEMARRAGGLVGQSPAVTFAGLAGLVLGRRCRFADDFERDLLVCALLEGTSLEALGGVKGLPGITDTTAALLLELRGSGKPVQEIQSILERWASTGPDVAGVAHDVGLLFAGYERASTRLGLTDQAAAVSEATRLAAGWHRPVALWGFASFTRGQRVLVEELSRRTEVLVVLAHDPHRGVGLCAPEEAEWWAERASEVVNVRPRERAYASPAIAYLERASLEGSLSRAPAEVWEADGVHFLLASGRRAEAELTAEHIAGLIRGGADPGSIAVIVRHVQSWTGLLGDVFTSCGIPWRADARCRLVDTGLGHAFLCALRGVALDDAEVLLSFLRSPYSGVELEEVWDLETCYRRGGEKGAGLLAGLAEGDAENALRRAWTLTDPPGREAGPAEGRALDPAAAIALAEEMLISGAQGADVGSPELEADARAFRSLQSALGRAADILPRGGEGESGSAATGTDALAHLSECLRPQAALNLLARLEVANRAGSDPEAVQILSAKRARARRFEVVFILGLVEGEFPGTAEGVSLLSASQRSSLDRLGGGIFAPAEEGEGTLFVGAASRAWRSLYLSARDAEDDGGEAVPSRFWQEAKVILGVGDKSHAQRTLREQVFRPESAPTLRHYLRACAGAGIPPVLDGLGRETQAVTPAWRRVPQRLRSPEVLAELEGVEHFGPSALEAYARCPFAWFIERVIGAEEVEAGLDGRMVGELIHQVLSESYRSFSADGRLPLAEDDLEEAEKTAEGVIERLLGDPGCPGGLADKRVAKWRLKSLVRRMLDMEAASDGLLRFAEAERDIGGTEGVDIGGIRIRGRIDRMDRTPDARGVFVFDYKSGGVPKALAIGTGEGLQLPLYLLALAAELEAAELEGPKTETAEPEAGKPEAAEVIGGAYVSLAEGKLAGVMTAGSARLLGSWPGRCLELDEEGWDQLVNDCRDTALSAADGIRSGVIAPRSDGSCPKWCALGSACRSRREWGGR